MALDTSILIRIDSLFSPFYWLLNRIYLTFSAQNNKVPEQHVIIKFFGMGSIVRIGSVIRNGKKPFENYHLVTLEKNRQAVELLGFTGIYIRYSNLGIALYDILAAIVQILKIKNAEIIDLERTSNLSGIFRVLCSFGKASASLSFGEKNEIKKNHRKVTLKNKPQLQAIAETLNISIDIKLKRRLNETRDSIVINVNAGEYIPERKYSIHQFSELIALLKAKYPFVVFKLTGSKHELEYTNQLSILLTEKKIEHINLAGKQNLTDLANTLKSAKILITNDSGPLHLSNYFSVPTVAIWGPTSPFLVGYPDSEIMRNVSINKDCSPCFIHPKSRIAVSCQGTISCLKDLPAQQIFKAACRILEPAKIEANVG